MDSLSFEKYRLLPGVVQISDDLRRIGGLGLDHGGATDLLESSPLYPLLTGEAITAILSHFTPHADRRPLLEGGRCPRCGNTEFNGRPVHADDCALRP